MRKSQPNPPKCPRCGRLMLPENPVAYEFTGETGWICPDCLLYVGFRRERVVECVGGVCECCG